MANVSNNNPLVASDFKLTISIEGQKLYLSSQLFHSFIIYELMKYNCYYAVLNLNDVNNKFKNETFSSTEKVKIKIEFSNDTEYEGKFIVLKALLDSNNLYSVYLIPEIFYSLCKDKYTKGFNDIFTNIVSDIIGDYDSEIDNSQGTATLFLQLNESNFEFIKNNYQEGCYDQYSDFSFFISKNDIIKLKSMNRIANSEDPIDYVADLSVLSVPLIEECSFDYQLNYGGLGSKGYYFDWENGEMKDFEMDVNNFSGMMSKSSKLLGINTDFVPENFESFMLNPIGDNDLFQDEDYNKKYLENLCLRKNIFGSFITFMYYGNINYTPLKMINYGATNFQNQTIFESILSGNYFIYNAIHILTLNSYQTNLTIAAPFIFNVDDSRYK
jgi:hypothetical protein